MPSRVNFRKIGKTLKSFVTKKQQRIGPERHSGSVFCRKDASVTFFQTDIFTQYVNMPFDRGWFLAWIFDVPNNPEIRHSKPCFVDFFKACVSPGAVGRGIVTHQFTRLVTSLFTFRTVLKLSHRNSNEIWRFRRSVIGENGRSFANFRHLEDRRPHRRRFVAGIKTPLWEAEPQPGRSFLARGTVLYSATRHVWWFEYEFLHVLQCRALFSLQVRYRT